ncbi:PadR family transcriptional regulator [Streptacidiphilus sp. N1-3]|uniref:PadR family transcriptional regulator n=1 Tax=Streptacidiphilus alkalitolerans TaxID=3342712 RepID=A0ABV6X709_9ACTN
MSLQHAILTALLEQPSSGLELTRRFDRSIGFFWSATHQQIYRDLARLEQSGLIHELPLPPAQGRRKEYEVLPAGRAELARWIGEEQPPRAAREPMALRMRALAAVVAGGEGDGSGNGEGDGAAVALAAEVARQLELHRQQLAEYRSFEARDLADGEPKELAQRLQHQVLRAGIGLEQFWADWLTETLAVIKDGQ